MYDIYIYTKIRLHRSGLCGCVAGGTSAPFYFLTSALTREIVAFVHVRVCLKKWT